MSFLPGIVGVKYFRGLFALSMFFVSAGLAQTPDLTVSGVTGPPTGSSGSPITVYWTASNIGTGNVSSGTLLFDGIYLSTDLTLDGFDIYVGSYFHVSGLNASTSEPDSMLLLLPDSLNGTYHIIVNTDEFSFVAESNESNNTSASSGTIAITSDAPDLVVSNLTVPLTGSSSQILPMSYTVLNNGTADIVNSSWFDYVYLSSDTVLGDSDDVFLDVASLDTSLDIGDSYSRSLSPSLPGGLSGMYYVLVETNAFQVLNESNTNNNHRSSAAVAIDLKRPDLVVSLINLPDTVNAGEMIRFSYQITNNGDTSTNFISWVDDVFLSSDSAVNTDTLLTARTRSFNLLQGQSVLIPESTSVPFGLQKGLYHLIVRLDVSNQINESDETNNVRISKGFLYGFRGPDLTVSNIVVPPSAFSGQQIQVSWTVTNGGTIATNVPAWYDKVFLSPNAVYNPDDVVALGYFYNVSYLAPGESYLSTQNVTLPNGVTGPYYIFVQADAFNLMVETNDDNNIARSDTSMLVNLSASPDLVVSTLTAPGTAFSDDTILVATTVKNAGNGTTAAGAWFDGLYLSQDSLFNASTATILKFFTHYGALSPESTYSVNSPIILPHAIFGTYYLFYVTDGFNQVYEYTAENNNRGRSAINIVLTPPPDLVVTAVSASPSGNSGKKIGVSWSVQNQGSTRPLEQSWQDRLYVSKLTTFNADSAFVLGTFSRGASLDPDSSYTRTDSAFVPNGLSGNYYVYAMTDWRNDVFEHLFEGNNVLRSTGTIQIQLTPWPDLQVTTFSAPSSTAAGQQVIVGWTVNNTGVADATGQLWKDNLYISSSPTWDPNDATLLKATQRTQPLSAGGNYAPSVVATLPTTISGMYYFYVVTDDGDAVYEHTDEGNNVTSSGAVDVQPYPPIDLRPSSVAVPGAGFSGTPVSVQFLVQNIGAGKTLQTKWDDAIYFSQDTILNAGQDSLVMIIRRQGALAPAESYGRDVSVRIPDGLFGNYYILALADTGNTIGDANIANNVAHSQSPINVTLSPPPDLQVISSSAPGAANSGQPVMVSWTVKNSGPGQTLVNGWNDAIYLSDDALLDPVDVRLGVGRHNGALTPNQSYSDSLEVILPSYAAGDLYILTQTDSKPEVFEQSNEANNVAANPIAVTLAAPSDLVVANISIQDTSIAGEEVTVTWKVRNQGANPASGRVTDAVYVSQNTSWEATDPMFGTYERVINLAPGAAASYSVKGNFNRLYAADSNGTKTAPVPGLFPGSYSIIVRTDIRNYIHENIEGNNTTTSANTTHIDLPALQLGVPTLTTIADGELKYYGVDVPGGQTMKLTLDGAASDGSLEMYTRFGGVPSRAQFDAAYTAPFAPDQVITVPETNNGSYYVLVFGDRVVGVPMQISLLAQVIPFGITSSSPSRGGNTGDVTIAVEGARFDSGSTVKLVGQGGVQPPVLRSEFIDASHLRATFDLSGSLPLGAYDVVVRRSDAQEATLAGGFTLEPGRAFSVNLGFGPPRAIAINSSGFYSISVENTTNVDLPFVSVLVLIPAGQSFTVTSNDVRTISQLESENLGTSYRLPDYFEDGLWRFVPLTARNVRVGQRLDIAFRVTNVQGTQFPIQIGVEAFDRKQLVESQLLYLELFRQAILLDTTGTLAPEMYNAAQSTDAFVNLVLPYYVSSGYLTAGDVAQATPGQIKAAAAKVAQMPINKAKLKRMFQPMLTECEDDVNWGYLAVRVAIIAVGIISGVLLAPVTLGVGAVLAVVGGLTLGLHIGTMINGNPSFIARLLCDDPRTPTPIVRSLDPNDITGPAGYGERKWVSVSDEMTYTVRFENDPKLATAPAQTVSVRLDVDSSFDMRTFRLEEFGFGSFSFDAAKRRSHYSERLDVRDSLGIYVDVNAGIDVARQQAFWNFTSIDPGTGERPANPLSGFLPVDDSLHRGEGFLKFTIKPKSSSHTGDSLLAQARIVFDVNDPIDTPPTSNTIDAGMPASAVHLLPSTQDTSAFIVRWGGLDDSTGSGLKNYTVYISKNDSPFVPWLSNVTDTSAIYVGSTGNHYGFFSLASDNAGNLEPMKSSADASTTITGVDGKGETLPAEFALHQNYPNPFNPATTIRFSLKEAGITTLKVYDLLGREVATLVSEKLPAGFYAKPWNASGFATGVYFYKLTAGRSTQVKKLLLMK